LKGAGSQFFFLAVWVPMEKSMGRRSEDAGETPLLIRQIPEP
jgi:hypothetical protein